MAWGKGFRKPAKREYRADSGGAQWAPAKLPPPLEQAEQEAFFDWIDRSIGIWPELTFVRAAPNERTSAVQRVQLAKRGVRTGPLDVMFPCPRGPYTGLWIEFKRAREGRWSESQIEYGRQLLAWGHCVTEARSAEQAIRIMDAYLNLRHVEPESILATGSALDPPAVLLSKEAK